MKKLNDIRIYNAVRLIHPDREVPCVVYDRKVALLSSPSIQDEGYRLYIASEILRYVGKLRTLQKI